MSSEMIIPQSLVLSFQTRVQFQSRLSKEELDLLIIGGGINGAWMAFDASLRGLKVGLVESKDFGHGPSRNNSELLHGGFRYLKEWYQNPKNWHKVKSVLKLVREALREREVLMKIAPHLARPVGFCMPLYAPNGLGWAKQSFYAIGFWMYDRLSAAHIIKPFKMLSRENTLKTLSGIKEKNLIGSGLYYDCKMEPGRFLIEIIKAAASKGALIGNYLKATNPIWETNENQRILKGFVCDDLLFKKSISITAKQIVDATGPWGDVFRQKIWGDKLPLLRLSKGIHIMVKQLFSEPIACAFFADDNRIIFIIPWGEDYSYSLIGTTDTDFLEHPDAVYPDQNSIDYLIKKVRALFPNANLHCFGNYAGIRPLVRQTEGSASSVSREHSIITHNHCHLTSVFGGKWTTARKVAQEVLDQVFPETKSKSHTERLRIGGENVAELLENGLPKKDSPFLHSLMEKGFQENTLHHLIFNYGKNASKIIDLSIENSSLKNPICQGMPFICAEIVYAVRYEMAMRVSDFLIRRSIFGRLRQRGLDAAPVVADIMAKEMGWDDQRKKEEIELFDKSTRILNI